MSEKIALVESRYRRLTPRQKYHVRSFCQYPGVGGNSAYMIGYLCALNDNGLMDYEDYTYWLAFCGTGLQDAELMAHVLTLEK